MTLSQLRAFCAVVDQGSFRAAARALDVAQSALTRAIQTLEAEFAVPLVNRTPRGISLTPFGEQLRGRARSILADCDRVGHDMRLLQGEPSGNIAVGLTAEPLSELLSPVLTRFAARFPRVSVHVSSGSTQTLIHKVRDGQLDFALCPIAPHVTDIDLSIERLYQSVPAIIARRAHPKARATSIRELADCKWVGFRTDGITGGSANRLFSVFATLDLTPPKITITADSLLESLHLVLSTDYLMLGPKVLTEQDLFAGSVTAVPVRERFSQRDVCFVRRHASSPTLVAQELAGMLVSYSRMQRRPVAAGLTDGEVTARR
ncbi:LysR substrate-binding domain-containing protein [Caballeronia sp. LjRoot34]|uniref:LysR family transcriptional regulator n=1 Tax=Caballeronia sp. LjRoot34 TaxID=3342325 RepID=UPI003ECF0CC1